MFSKRDLWYGGVEDIGLAQDSPLHTMVRRKKKGREFRSLPSKRRRAGHHTLLGTQGSYPTVHLNQSAAVLPEDGEGDCSDGQLAHDRATGALAPATCTSWTGIWKYFLKSPGRLSIH